jgi:hypothetical protein
MSTLHVAAALEIWHHCHHTLHLVYASKPRVVIFGMMDALQLAERWSLRRKAQSYVCTHVVLWSPWFEQFLNVGAEVS